MERKLEITLRNTSELMPYAKNAKKHPKKQVEEIAASIEAFGFNDPIATWHDEIVEGHGRLLAAKLLGIEQVPTISLDELTDEQRRAYIHIHNKLAVSTQTDWAALQEEIASMPEINWEDFGVQKYTAGDFTDAFTLPDLDTPKVRTITLQCGPEQHKKLMDALDTLTIEDCRLQGGNEAGAKIAEVVKQWAEQQKSN